MNKKQMLKRLCNLMRKINNQLDNKYKVDCFCGEHVDKLINIDNLSFEFDSEFLDKIEDVLTKIYFTKNALDWVQTVNDALLSGKKTLAVKIYKQHTGLSLKEARYAIDKIKSYLQGMTVYHEERERDVPF